MAKLKKCLDCRRVLGKKDAGFQTCSTCRLKSENRQLRVELSDTKTKLKKLKETAQYPVWFKIKESTRSCTQEYLQQLLTAIAPFSTSIIIETGRN